jgi:aminopeptidase YwaD
VRRMTILVVLAGCVELFAVARGRTQKPPLLPEKDVAALANELSGETAKRNLEGIARFHRQRGSIGFHEAAELVAERLRAYGLSDVAILQFPADGKILYGTQRSRPAWDAEIGELRVIDARFDMPCGKNNLNPSVLMNCVGGPVILHESYNAEPVVLAEDSESGDKIARLVDVGEGTKDSDYTDKDVKGAFVLVGAQPGAVQDLAIARYGAVGIISYAQNQKTAWWGEDENLIRWGHLETFSLNKTLAFMVSLKSGRDLKQRLANDDPILVHAIVKAGQHAGNYEVVTATIPGADPKLKEEEIAFSCHLDHQRPGANDNASGCATILEVARTLQRLIDEKKLERSARTIRFVFPPEIEGTLALLTGRAQAIAELSPVDSEGQIIPDADKIPTPILLLLKFPKKIKAVIHMDMVGGGPETKAVFHVTRGPMSLPSFVHDVAWAFADWVNEESYKFAATGKADYPMVAPEGGKDPLRAEYSAFTMGSDHDVYQDSSFGIPAIYMNDWPDRYIHTNFDSAANIDPTKLKRAAFIGAASGYFLAREIAFDVREVTQAQGIAGLLRHAETRHRARGLPEEEAESLFRAEAKYNRRMEDSYIDFVHGAVAVQAGGNVDVPRFLPWEKGQLKAGTAAGDGRLIFARKPQPKGPPVVFGYDYFSEHAKATGIATPKLLSYEGLWGAGEEYAYETLNFADGKRNAQEIRDAVSAEYGPVPLELVVDYLKALEKIDLLAITR